MSWRSSMVRIPRQLSMCLLLGLSQQHPMQGIHRQQVCQQETYYQSDYCANMQKFHISVLCRKDVDGRDLLDKKDRAPGHKVEADLPEPCHQILRQMQKPKVAWKFHLNKASRRV